MHNPFVQAGPQRWLQEARPPRHQGDPQVRREGNGHPRRAHRHPTEQAHLVQGHPVSVFCFFCSICGFLDVSNENFPHSLTGALPSAFASDSPDDATTMRIRPTSCSRSSHTFRFSPSRVCRPKTSSRPTNKLRKIAENNQSSDHTLDGWLLGFINFVC